MTKNTKKPQGKKVLLKKSKDVKTVKNKSVAIKPQKVKTSSLAKTVKRIAMTLVKKAQPQKATPKTLPKKIVTPKSKKLNVQVAKEIAVKKKTEAKTTASVTTGPFGIKPYQQEKDESYMSKRQLKHFTEILNAWKGQLMTEVDRTIYDLQEVPNYADPIDRASQEEEFNLKLRERDRERKLIRKIDEALLRIKEGNYGYCDECGAEIGVRRLEARPTATQCIECKTIAEIREKQTGT